MLPEAAVRSFAELAAEVLAEPPRLGAVRVVSVDGGAGSGKTTFAGRLGSTLGCQVLHTDDLLAGWTDVVGFWPRLEEWVLAPLRAGRVGRYRRYDWEREEFAEWHDVRPGPVLVIEGVTAARAVVRPELARSVWVETPAPLRLERGIARDGERLRPQWERWMLHEAAFFAVDRTAVCADVVVAGDSAVRHDPETQFVQLRAPTDGAAPGSPHPAP